MGLLSLGRGLRQGGGISPHSICRNRAPLARALLSANFGSAPICGGPRDRRSFYYLFAPPPPEWQEERPSFICSEEL